ncbi:cytochrome P450 [Mycena rebaudengoi]|nr:cytochrome P450 [Mycena rebaudengoi]
MTFDYGPTLLLLLLPLAVWLTARSLRRGSTTTQLNGPPSQSLIWGLSDYSHKSPDISVDLEDWVKRYGPAYELPAEFGRKKIIITDPKAVVHFYSSEQEFGRGVLWAEGEMHKRQRKALTPAFSNAAIRKLTSVFYDSAYKLKSLWDSSLESSPDGAVIEVQQWQAISTPQIYFLPRKPYPPNNRLDSIGLGGFSHDFRSLDGEKSSVTAAFDALQATKASVMSSVVFTLAFMFPFLLNIPTERIKLFWRLRDSLNVIAERLLDNSRREKAGEISQADKSVIGLLLRAEGSSSELYMTQEEIVAQNILLLAGYETTSISLTWALIELSRHPKIQEKLRQDIARFGADPTWDQLVSDLPYLDSVVNEVLRLHPPVTESLRVAQHDDVIPFSTPVTTASGESVTSIFVAKGSSVVAPIRCINRSEALWGPDSKEFKPERWLSDITVRANELLGYRHLLTFHDGPRTCLGRAFALAEFKATLSVLIRHFSFEFPDGPDTKIENHITIVPRPKVAGLPGAQVPLRVRRVE